MSWQIFCTRSETPHSTHPSQQTKPCTDNAWRSDPRTLADVTSAGAAAGVTLRGAACVGSGSCLTAAGGAIGGGGAAVQFVEREPEITPGGLLAQLPGEAVHCVVCAWWAGAGTTCL